MIKKIDRWIMLALSWATSTKSAFYVLSLLIICSIVASPPTNVQGWLLVVVTVYYQGVSLPAIGSMSKTEGEATRALLLQIHEENQRQIALIQKALHVADIERREMYKLAHYLHERLDEKGDA